MKLYQLIKRHARRVVVPAAAGAASTLSGVPGVMAQASSDLGVDTDALQTSTATSVGGYVGWAIAVAVGIIGIWALVKYARRGVAG